VPTRELTAEQQLLGIHQSEVMENRQLRPEPKPRTPDRRQAQDKYLRAPMAGPLPGQDKGTLSELQALTFHMELVRLRLEAPL
jgi:hypothetical protein